MATSDGLAAQRRSSNAMSAFMGAPELSIHPLMPPPDIKGVMPHSLTLDGKKLENAFMSLHDRLLALESYQAAMVAASKSMAERAAADLEADFAEGALLATQRDALAAADDAAAAEGGTDSRGGSASGTRQMAALRAKVDTALARMARREKSQLERDAAQDALRQMELKRMAIQLESKVSPHDLEHVGTETTRRIAYMEEQVRDLLALRMREAQATAEGQITSVMALVTTMQAQVDGMREALSKVEHSLEESAGEAEQRVTRLSTSIEKAVEEARAMAVAAAEAASVVAAVQTEEQEQEKKKEVEAAVAGVLEARFAALMADSETGKIPALAPVEAELETLHEAQREAATMHGALSDELLEARVKLASAESQLQHLRDSLAAQLDGVDDKFAAARQDARAREARLEQLTAALAATDRGVAPLAAQIQEAKLTGLEAARIAGERAAETTIAAAAAVEKKLRSEQLEETARLKAASDAIAESLDKARAAHGELEAAAVERFEKLEERAAAAEGATAELAAKLREDVDVVKGATVELAAKPRDDVDAVKLAAKLREDVDAVKAAAADEVAAREAAERHTLALVTDEEQRRKDGDDALAQALRAAEARDAELTAALGAAKRDAALATDMLKTEVQEALAALLPPPPQAQQQAVGHRGGGGSKDARGNGMVYGGTAQSSGNGGGGGGGGGASGAHMPIGVTTKMLRAHAAEGADALEALQRSGVANALALRRVETAFQSLASKGLFWESTDIKLAAHVEEVARVSLQVEAAAAAAPPERASERNGGKRGGSAPPGAPHLAPDALRVLAGNTQRVAKLIAAKADYEVIRLVSRAEDPGAEGHDWDARVETLRGAFLAQFSADARNVLRKRAPHQGPAAEAARGRFLARVDGALRVALSKYRPTTPGATLFGRVRVVAQACVACDRPFATAADGLPCAVSAPPGGNHAAAKPPALPTETSIAVRNNFRPSTCTGSPTKRSGGGVEVNGDDGDVESEVPLHVAPFGFGGGGGGGGGGGSDVQKPQAYVYRGGFKLPKHSQVSSAALLSCSLPNLSDALGGNGNGGGGGGSGSSRRQARPQTSAGSSGSRGGSDASSMLAKQVPTVMFQPAFPPLYNELQGEGSTSTANTTHLHIPEVGPEADWVSAV
ncbi:hypothetical protein JKP88DRAFT_286456 [Tribonema minus]|uniref:Uncharacterized protein n=1 Tax=Tribonema minus TaxID=303371 RepID=A0A836CLL5_9STRA|nr:hypothetical protein JKP88DRAFT_286456 [Tribonema minus]